MRPKSALRKAPELALLITSHCESYTAPYGPLECGSPSECPASCATTPARAQSMFHMNGRLRAGPSTVTVLDPPHEQQPMRPLKCVATPLKREKSTSASAAATQSVAMSARFASPEALVYPARVLGRVYQPNTVVPSSVIRPRESSR